MSARDETLIAEISKNSREVIRVTAAGSDVRIRVWFRADDDDLRPGREGIALHAAIVAEVAAALAKAVRS